MNKFIDCYVLLEETEYLIIGKCIEYENNFIFFGNRDSVNVKFLLKLKTKPMISIKKDVIFESTIIEWNKQAIAMFLSLCFVFMKVTHSILLFCYRANV